MDGVYIYQIHVIATDDEYEDLHGFITVMH